MNNVSIGCITNGQNYLEPEDTGFTKTNLIPIYMVKLRDEDGRIIARCLNVQGAVTDGANEDEAMENIREAIDGILEASDMNKEYYIMQIH